METGLVLIYKALPQKIAVNYQVILYPLLTIFGQNFVGFTSP